MLALAGILAYGGFRVQRGALTLGVVVAFLQYGLRFFRPIQDLSEKYNILQGAMASAERIFKLVDTEAGILAPAEPRPAPVSARIEFEGVWFAYKDEDWVLRDVSFTVNPGETIAVVGHTGAGKTTLISLLLRFYDVAERRHPRGRQQTSANSIRRSCAACSAWSCRTLICSPARSRRTSGWARRASSRRAVEEAAEQVNLLDFIHSLPDGFGYAIRERGSGLSTGQKQLISFARALAHNPRFLILDEATSSVDTETELRVREALSRLVEGRTSIIIAHRLSTIQRADRILVMHKGRLRESRNASAVTGAARHLLEAVPTAI